MLHVRVQLILPVENYVLALMYYTLKGKQL
jgi:hypothetical protein